MKLKLFLIITVFTVLFRLILGVFQHDKFAESYLFI
jgi:uncharacterized protein YneF (UPF0154 family)